MENIINILINFASQTAILNLANKLSFVYSSVLLKVMNNQQAAFQILDVFL
ncbi:MAG: hypothetical protein R2764_12105 [Bacteroidales bacterium]